MRSQRGDQTREHVGPQLALLLLRADQHPRHEVVRHHAKHRNKNPVRGLRSSKLILFVVYVLVS